MKKMMGLILSLSMVISLVSCGQKKTEDTKKVEEKPAVEVTKDEPKADAEVKDVKDLKLGFILGSREHAFYRAIEDGIKEAAAEMGFTAIVDESDLNGAVASERIENMVVEGLDAISLAANEPGAVVKAIEDADKQGVPMFTFDCTADTPALKSFVGTDNYKGGVLGGEETLKVLDKLGKKDGAIVGVIGYPEPQSTIDREQGWMEVMEANKEKYNLTIVNIGSYGGDATKAQNLMSDALISHPEMDVIFTVGDPACIGALAAIKSAGAHTTMIGFDGNPEAIEAILDPENGKIWLADIAQNPKGIGRKIAEQMVKYVTTGKVDSESILIEPYVLDASNAK